MGVQNKTATEDLLLDREFVCNSAVWYMYSVYFLSLSPLFCASLADCNSVNDFDLSWDWGQEPQRERREMAGDESRVGGWL